MQQIKLQIELEKLRERKQAKCSACKSIYSDTTLYHTCGKSPMEIVSNNRVW